MKALRSLIPRRGQSASFRSALARWSTMRWAAVVVSDRRWAVALSASAIGMGLFIGIAIGPGVDRSQGTEAQTVAVATTDAGGSASESALPAAPPAGDNASPATGSPATPPPPSSPPSSTSIEPSPVEPLGGIDAPAPITPSVSETKDETTTSGGSEEATGSEDSKPTTEETELALDGTVAHLNPFAGSYALVAGDGTITAVHAKPLPNAATKLHLTARALANGTYAAEGASKRQGSKTRTKLRGVVSYADSASGEYTVSQTGVSVLVHPDPGSRNPPPPPPVGSEVVVKTTIGEPPAAVNGPSPATDTSPQGAPAPTTTTTTTTTTPRRAANCGGSPKRPEQPKQIVTEVSRRVAGGVSEQTGLEGVVEAVCEPSGILVLSADDARESGAQITLRVADENSTIDLASLNPCNVVAATAAIDPQTRNLELTGVARDDGIKRADDSSLTQVDQQE
jgi:hypothetical protein